MNVERKRFGFVAFQDGISLPPLQLCVNTAQKSLPLVLSMLIESVHNLYPGVYCLSKGPVCIGWKKMAEVLVISQLGIKPQRNG